MSFSKLTIIAAAVVAITIIITIIIMVRGSIQTTVPLTCHEGSVLDYNGNCIVMDNRICATGEVMNTAGECVPAGTIPQQENCIRGNNVTTWGTQYDSCDVENLALMKCLQGDKRWAYDAMWDSRLARGYNCGPTQVDYLGNNPDSVCNTAVTTGSISYDKLTCTKY